MKRSFLVETQSALTYWIIWPCLAICLHLHALYHASFYAESLKMVINSVNFKQKLKNVLNFFKYFDVLKRAGCCFGKDKRAGWIFHFQNEGRVPPPPPLTPF